MQHPDTPITDPMPHLAPTARRILEAALRLLDQDGFKALTFERIAREAGENKASIRYHFGSKSGLVRALIDVVFYSDATELMHRLPSARSASERRQVLFERRRQVSTRLVRSRRLYELLPVILEDPDLRPKLREVMQWYRTLDAWVLPGEELDQEQLADIEPLAILSVAVLEGISLQYQADPELDVASAFGLWERLVLQRLQSSRREGLPTGF